MLFFFARKNALTTSPNLAGKKALKKALENNDGE